MTFIIGIPMLILVDGTKIKKKNKQLAICMLYDDERYIIYNKKKHSKHKTYLQMKKKK